MPGKNNNFEWLTEAETVDKLGLKNARQLRRLVSSCRLYIAYSQINQRSARRYLKADVEKALLENSTVVSPLKFQINESN